MPTIRKSNEYRKITSTKSHCPEADNADFKSGRPKMPDGLPLEAAKEWRRLVPKLCRRKTLTKADCSCLEIYVRMWARYIKIADQAQAHPLTPDGEESAASKIACRLESNLRNLLKELSATPASRRHTKPPKQEPPNDAGLPSVSDVVLPEPTIDLFNPELMAAMEAVSAPPPTPEAEIPMTAESRALLAEIEEEEKNGQ